MKAAAISVAHPCPWTIEVLDEVARELNLEAERLGLPRLAVIDPCAGTGERVFNHPTYQEHVYIGLELEESFIAAPWVQHGNARHIPYGAGSFDAYATSFVFPNGMCDSFISSEADDSYRMTYSHKARKNRGDRTYVLHADHAGRYSWARGSKKAEQRWKELHVDFIREGIRVLKPGGLFIVEMKDHWAGDELVPVAAWLIDRFVELGCTLEGVTRIPVRGNRKGSNREIREEHTNLILARTP